MWRALVALAFMLALSPLLFAEQLLREMFRPRTAYERGYDDGYSDRQNDYILYMDDYDVHHRV